LRSGASTKETYCENVSGSTTASGLSDRTLIGVPFAKLRAMFSISCLLTL